jgi:outer membrane protein OmpA-like peptidoglycan-associated protein
LFATDRDEPGNLDLWAFELPGYAKAEEVALRKGMVRDAVTKRPIAATVQVLDEFGRRMGEQRSSDSDGAFTLTFPSSEQVILQVDEPGFAFYSEVLDSSTDLSNSVVVELNRLEVGTVLVLRDVRFERSSAELNANFQPDLEQLARTLKTSDVRIRISGHTDGEGSASRNQALSEARAEAVRLYLLALGIGKDRMEVAGFGQMRPIASNETPEGRALNRRTEIEIIQ